MHIYSFQSKNVSTAVNFSVTLLTLTCQTRVQVVSSVPFMHLGCQTGARFVSLFYKTDILDSTRWLVRGHGG